MIKYRCPECKEIVKLSEMEEISCLNCTHFDPDAVRNLDGECCCEGGPYYGDAIDGEDHVCSFWEEG